MTKKNTIFLTTIIIVIMACGSTTPHLTPEPVYDVDASPVPEQSVSPAESLETEQGAVTEVTVSVPGLRVVYIRGGNLWSWTEAGGASQLTDIGDMSTIRVSDDGQLLAFMRGNEIWTVRMDGTDARLVDTQMSAGGKLWLAPNNALLAVSTSDHMDVLDLNNGGKTTVVTYPLIPGGYAPEVIWMPDSSGFKTVVPSPTEGGQAEMLYVFPDGTLASLAKFAMVSSPDSPYYFSPDGGYVIYVAKAGDGQEALHLMDSSGATRPYGEPAARVRVYGWLPDAKRFAYGVGEPQQTIIGIIDGPSAYNETGFSGPVRWTENEHYLTIQADRLILGNLQGESILIDSGVAEFDISPLN